MSNLEKIPLQLSNLEWWNNRIDEYFKHIGADTIDEKRLIMISTSDMIRSDIKELQYRRWIHFSDSSALEVKYGFLNNQRNKMRNIIPISNSLGYDENSIEAYNLIALLQYKINKLVEIELDPNSKYW